MMAEKMRTLEKKSLELVDSWFIRFKKRNYPHNMTVQGEAANAVVDSIASHLEDMAKTIDEGGYFKQQIFNLGE
jgi:hypothetical protein